jgi:competence protein ComEA
VPDVLPEGEPSFELPRPEVPASLGERVAGWAESLDLTPTRLAVGLIVLMVGGVVAWRVLAPPALPPEMELPFASTTAAAPAATGGEAAGAGAGQAGASGEPGGGPVAAATGGSGPVGEVVVHVAGAVRVPGVQRLTADARVVDAVEAAGGATGDADLARINLAALLEDGQQIYVPRVGEPLPPAPAGGGGAPAGGGAGTGSASGSAASTSGGLVNLNQATLAELEELPGVGPAIAQAIIDHREQQGPFTSVDQLLEVRGIGDARLAELRDRVTV